MESPYNMMDQTDPEVQKARYAEFLQVIERCQSLHDLNVQYSEISLACEQQHLDIDDTLDLFARIEEKQETVILEKNLLFSGMER